MKEGNIEDKKIQLTVLDLFDKSTPLVPYGEKINKMGYVEYGYDNLYPDYLIGLMNSSSKHNAILGRKTKMIAGGGFNKEGLDQIALDIIKNINNDDSLNDIVYKCAYDLEVFGAFTIEVVYSRDGSKIVEVNFLPTNKIRLSEDNKEIYYSSDWKRFGGYGQSKSQFAPIKKPAFNKDNPVKSQILYSKEYKPGIEYYGQPYYLPAVNWLELENEISTFHLKQVQNGFFPTLVINMRQGEPTQEQMREIVAQLKNDYQGASGENVICTFSGPDDAPIITPIELNDSDKKFIELNKEITQAILTAHEIVNPSAFGVSTTNSLGEKNVIMDSIELFQSLYVNHKQEFIERIFNKIIKFNGSSTPLTLNKYKLDIEKITEGNDE